MRASDLSPASYFAKQYGVKCLCYGQAGSGKTPVINTAPNPVLLNVEPGLLSMRDSNVPTYVAETEARITEFMNWATGSAEMAQFDTLCIDSISQVMEILVFEDEQNNPSKHGLQIYGEAASKVLSWAQQLYYMRNKHVYLTTKLAIIDLDSRQFMRPYFPGKELNTRIPHLYDLITMLGDFPIPGVGNAQAFKTKGDSTFLARDRSGRLDLYEQPNLTNVINKCMS